MYIIKKLKTWTITTNSSEAKYVYKTFEKKEREKKIYGQTEKFSYRADVKL